MKLQVCYLSYILGYIVDIMIILSLSYVYPTCILRISYVYLTCILRISYVYPTCILRVSYEYPTSVFAPDKVRGRGNNVEGVRWMIYQDESFNTTYLDISQVMGYKKARGCPLLKKHPLYLP